MKLTLQSLVRNHTNFLSTHFHYNNVALQASNDQPAAYLHGNSNHGTKSGGKVLVLLQFKNILNLFILVLLIAIRQHYYGLVYW